MKDESDKNLWQIAQDATDAVYGEGAYVRLNGFDPSKGETHKAEHIEPSQLSEKTACVKVD